MSMGTGRGGMGGQGMGTGTRKEVPPMKRYTCPNCRQLFLHREAATVTCPHCRLALKNGQETGK